MAPLLYAGDRAQSGFTKNGLTIPADSKKPVENRGFNRPEKWQQKITVFLTSDNWQHAYFFFHIGVAERAVRLFFKSKVFTHKTVAIIVCAGPYGRFHLRHRLLLVIKICHHKRLPSYV
jgi:hypothetical protein